MRRYSLLFLLFVVVGIGTYASFSQQYVADTTLLRVPRYQVGTLGYLFEKILGVTADRFDSNTGLVVNTSHLGWRTRYEYLKAWSPTCGVGEAWTAIDTSGVAICSPVWAPATLAMIGKSWDMTGTVMVYRANQALPIAMTSGMDIMDGDIVQTSSSGTIGIIFTDDSIIRLSGDSTLALNIGSSTWGGQIAQAILQNGNLWGRILSETGVYNIGTADIVAAVRGTSLALSKTGISITSGSFRYNAPTASGWSISPPDIRWAHPTTLTVVDSSLGASRDGVVQIDCLKDSTAISLGVEQKIITDGKCSGRSPTTATAAVLYASSDGWVKSNTIKDIDYMGNLLTVSGTTWPDGSPTGNTTNSLSWGLAKQAKLLAEYQESKPNTPAELSSLCQGTDEWNVKYGGCVPRGMIAFADYRNGNLNFRYKDNLKPDVPGANSGGILIRDPENRKNGIYLSGTGVIKYSPYALRDTFEIDGVPNIVIDLANPILTSWSKYLLAFGNNNTSLIAWSALYDAWSPRCYIWFVSQPSCITKSWTNRYTVSLISGLSSQPNLYFWNSVVLTTSKSIQNTIRTIFLTE